MNHVHVSIISAFAWLFYALIWGPIWRTAAFLLSKRPIGQALAYAGPGF